MERYVTSAGTVPRLRRIGVYPNLGRWIHFGLSGPSGQVRSSIARRLSLDVGGLVPGDRDVEGVVEMMLDATGKFDEPLTEERLFAWHASLERVGRPWTPRLRRIVDAEAGGEA